MKRAWDPAVLTVLWWSGDEPKVGDVLKTSTGRRYWIQRIRYGRDCRTVIGKVVTVRRGVIRAFETVVLPKDERVRGRVFDWQWGKRTKCVQGRRVFRGMTGMRARP